MKLNLSGKRSTKQQAKKGAKQTPLLTSPQSAMSTTDPTNFITEDKLTKKSRRIFLNIDAKDHKNRPLNQTFCTNRISTTKYTFYTFIPKNVYEQFRSIPNLYFLALALLQLAPQFKIVDFGLTIAPIAIIVFATALKDAIEDYRRFKTDASVNASQTYVLRNSIISEEQEHEQEKEAIPTILLNIFIHGITEYFLYPLRIIKRPKENPNRVKKAPFLMTHDYIIHERPKRNSIAMRASTMQPPLNEAYWKLKHWANVKVGDFVLLRADDAIPADIAIVATSESDCICFIETKNLDGETNLKIRRGIPELKSVKSANDCLETKCFVDVEAPNEHMYSFTASLRINPQTYDIPRISIVNRRASIDKKASIASMRDRGGILVPIGINGVLLRGCMLRNTDWVIGIILYTGNDTKLMRNSGITPSKRSRIDRQLNPQVKYNLQYSYSTFLFFKTLLNFMILFGLCFISGILGAVYQGAFDFAAPTTNNSFLVSGQAEMNVPFVETTGILGSTTYTFLITFFSCVIIFQNIIPIALYISVDVAKTIQSFLINLDVEMYDVESGKFVQSRTWNLCDDLGQIEYIFSDKTGTLTCNVMEFRRCSINGIMYGNSYPSDMSDIKKYDTSPNAIKTKRELDEIRMRDHMKDGFDCKYVSPDSLSFIDPELHKHLNKGGEQAVAIKQFYALLSVCHTVLVETYEDDSNAVIYKAQSPDEKALVEAARDIGFAFLKRSNNSVTVNMLGEDQTFVILHVMEFNSDRKRMSIILKPPPAMNLAEGDVLLFCKGADSVIYDRLSPSVDQDFKTITQNHLEIFGNEGLRTLCLGFRIISKAEYEPWALRFAESQAMLEDREMHIDRVSDEVERNLKLMGATAIEDRLQDGVPESISVLSQGDKMETAINIGFSCNLLGKHMKLIVITGDSCEDTHSQLKEALTQFWSPEGEPLEGSTHALIIDGTSLTYVFDERNDKKKVRQATLLELACRCTSVVCCRVSPLQKAQVVSLVRKGLGAMCLSIGDGANDVSMIQEADVGIGISGKEGLQAVMASDYAIAQFKFLTRLLLVHGRWAYTRTSEMILLYFYKNVLFLLILFWYQFDSGFTADSVVDFSYGIFFNTIFTLLPNMVAGILDQDVNDKFSLMFPGLYGRGIRQELYSMERFWLYIFDGIYQSVISYYFAQFTLGEGAIDQRGYIGGKDLVGTMIALNAIITINLYIGMNNFSWTWITVFAIFATISVFFIYVVLHANDISSATFGQAQILMTEPQLYFEIVLTVIASLLPRVAIKAIQENFYPNDTDIVQEIMKYNLVDKFSYPVSQEDKLLNSSGGQSLQSSKKPAESYNHDLAESASVELQHDQIQVAPILSSAGSTSFQPQIIRRISSSKDLSLKRKLFPSKDELNQSSNMSNSIGINKSRRHSNHILSDAVSNMKDVFIQPLLNVGGYVKKKLRIGSTIGITNVRNTTRAGSLVYMGTKVECNNTGFAFSHEGGMEDVITPSIRSPFQDAAKVNYPLEEILELPEDEQPHKLSKVTFSNSNIPKSSSTTEVEYAFKNQILLGNDQKTIKSSQSKNLDDMIVPFFDDKSRQQVDLEHSRILSNMAMYDNLESIHNIASRTQSVDSIQHVVVHDSDVEEPHIGQIQEEEFDDAVISDTDK